MADPPQIRQTRKNLGQRLAELRHAAGLNQHELATAVNYARSTVANIEVGRQNAPAEFWERCDTILNAAGTLRAAYHALCLAQSAHRHDEARRHPSAADPAAPAHDAREGLAHRPVTVVGSPVLAGRLAQLLAPGMATSAPPWRGWCPG
ncbi:helix-turn-helix domain-containing protein [Phytohabitans rumicis]|uniref:HTH cro/C1-type domain-containing protein n=1 Tax=Phytohabitans rumicis TaxID=1076125 RepID=A0A6V8LKS4_9ACTN|nr:helix-turn-helix transcriptional regulator [Phytohabitans rumicis]GFJ93245.1 hypothetical protein Prum_068870 [Phytohabitans rumicis]